MKSYFDNLGLTIDDLVSMNRDTMDYHYVTMQLSGSNVYQMLCEGNLTQSLRDMKRM